MSSIIHYFTTANSSRGFVSFFADNFGRLANLIYLDRCPDDFTQPLFHEILHRAEELEMSVEVIHSCLDNSIEGVILPESSTGIINFSPYDGNSYSALSFLGDENLSQMQSALKDAYSKFAEALRIHDGWEKIYIEHMNFEAENQLTEQTIEKLIGSQSLEKSGKECHRYFGAATVDGSFDYIPNLTEKIEKRYFLKGRPGTGKSTFLKKVGKAALEKGFDVEFYHCAFDPNSLDLVAIRELGVCIFDSTAPHEYFPTRQNDEIIDIYAIAVEPGVDEKYAQELSSFQKQYKETIKKATDDLKRVKAFWNAFQTERFLKTDEKVYLQKEQEILQRIFKNL